MRKTIVLLSLFFSVWAQGQDLLNFYLEPNGSGSSVTLYTTVYHYNVALYLEHTIDINDNVIDFNLCYSKTSQTAETYDQKEFVINLPSGFSNFIFNINFYTWDETGICDYSNVLDSGNINFDFPYNPIEKTVIPDDNFEGYLEAKGFGDEVLNNNTVFKHRFVNLTRLHMNIYDLNQLGLQEIENLSGIEYLTRLSVLKCSENFISEFDASLYPELRWLDLGGNELNVLDLTQNLKLIILFISNNPIQNIDLSQNIELEILFFGSEAIFEIDLSQNININTLTISNTNMAEINLDNIVGLKYLRINNNNSLISLNLENNINLEGSVYINNNSALESIVFGESPNLTNIVCNENNLLEIDFSGCISLTNVSLTVNQIEQLDFSQNINIEYLILFNNNLNTLNLKNGNNEILETVIAFNNPNLYCITVDNPNNAPYGQWLLDNDVIYSEDCSLLATNDIDSISEIILFPNPVNTLLNLVSQNPIKSIRVFNILGKEVFAEDENINQIDFSNYTNGLYFIKFETNKGVVFKKVVKH